eukprot:8452329-Heterocapsa_arctica.AAC.1
MWGGSPAWRRYCQSAYASAAGVACMGPGKGPHNHAEGKNKAPLGWTWTTLQPHLASLESCPL